jgi:chemotaxis protein MotB
VSQATHDRQLEGLRAEVARLDAESRDQTRSLEAMERERDGLLEEIEDLRDARESLQADVAARDEKLREMRGSYDLLVQDLEADVAAGQHQIEQLTEGLSFRLPQDVLFPPGSAVLEPKGRKAVAEIAARIKDREGRVEVQGHTDDRAIGGALAQRYPTNWELAGARAASVVRVLEESGVAGERLAAVSFGPTRPIVSNETAEGRAQNRRIEVRLLPTAAAPLPGVEPAAGAPASVDAAPPGTEGDALFEVLPEAAAEPEPAAEAQPPREAEVESPVELPTEPGAETEPEAAAEPEAPAVAEPAAETEPAAEPEPAAEAEPEATEPEGAVDSDAASGSEAAAEPERAAPAPRRLRSPLTY